MPTSTPTSIEVFKRFSLGTRSTPPTPKPQFPQVPAAIKSKFPELETHWDQWMKDIQDWVRANQVVSNA